MKIANRNRFFYLCVSILFLLILATNCSEKKPEAKPEKSKINKEKLESFHNAPPPGAKKFQLIKSSENFELYLFPEYREWNKLTSNAYGIVDKATKKAIIIDPGVASTRMIHHWVTINKLDLVIIAVTHSHLDHTGGVEMLRDFFPKAKFYAPEKDADWLGEKDMRIFKGLNADPPKNADRLLKDNDIIELGKLVFDVIATPGHTVGSVCYSLASEKSLFTGDTLFKRSVGRTDLPHAIDHKTLIRSIKANLGHLPDNTGVFSGHGAVTNLGIERKKNQHLN